MRVCKRHKSREGTRPFYFSSPEDIILNKLEWYKMGDEVSTRQWGDIIGVMRRQAKTLDLAYLRQWAGELNVLELLERAFAETGLQETLEILQDEELMESFHRGVQDIEEGKVQSWEEVKKDLELE